jgi:hypothetical protein
MNCLVFSLKYKAKHKDVKIRIEHHVINIINKHGFGKSLFRFFKIIGLIETLLIIIEPHFYVVDNGFRLDADPYSKLLRYSKTKISCEIESVKYFEELLKKDEDENYE